MDWEGSSHSQPAPHITWQVAGGRWQASAVALTSDGRNDPTLLASFHKASSVPWLVMGSTA